MPYEFKLPDLGEGIAEVELRRWLVREGDRIAEHQTVLEVESDKAVVEVPSPRAGIVARLLRREGETVKVGEPLFSIAAEGEDVTGRRKSVGIVGTLPEADEISVPSTHEEREVRATPMVRKLAREQGIDLASLQGSGPHGSVTLEELELASSPARVCEEAFGPLERLPLRGVRRSIARNVSASRQLTASVTTMDEADITDLWEIRNREQQEVESHHGSHLTFLPFIIKAAQHALREHPYLNASIDDAAEEIVLKRHFHFGIAVETADGLMVPVIRDVDRKSILDLAEEIQLLGKKARERTIGLDEMKGSSFTITNYGHFGGTYATPIINLPDVAILGCGRIAERPWVHQGAICIRRIISLSFTFDHRITDGADAAQFLGKVARYLEDPALLFLEGT